MEKLYGAFGLIKKDLDQSIGFDSVVEMQKTAAQRGHKYKHVTQNSRSEYFYIVEAWEAEQ